EVATLLARSVLPQRINDPMCGFFVLRRGVYEKIRDRLRPRGYKILLEIVHRASPLRVREFPYVFRDRKSGYSKLSAFVAVSYLESLFELRFGFSPLDRLREKYHRGRYKIVEGMLGGGTLLDVGCGRPCDSMPDGALLEHLGRGVGLDIKACVGRSEFVRGGLLQMPFRSGAFDRVSALEVLEHMDDLPAALAEVDRVLKPGGVFVVSVPDDNLAWKCIWWVWVKLIGRMWRHTHHTHFQAAQWRRVLSERFDVVSFRRHWYFDLVFQLRRRG
ncbi:MAG TPA: methyltransferase domain-containing protein, partial [Elusimicrobiota bacterium]|nr:methyltransferase domain-containing protein [Elusimicrobiota bacterium]